jgi:hypothetical protein
MFAGQGVMYYALGIPRDEDEESKSRPVKNFRQFYILLHHAVYWVYVFGNTGLTESCFSSRPYLFYVILFFYCISLDCYASACDSPGIVTDDPENTENLHFCETCKHHCPVRAGHCHTCGHCVLRRDHHCPWTGGCIGRDNHLAFFGFVFFETIISTFGTINVLKHFLEPAPIWRWLYRNCGGIFLLASSGFDSVFVTGLLFGHIRNILRNETIWEKSRRATISYFRDCSLTQRPFDNGRIANIIEFITMKADGKQWDFPRPATVDDYIQEKIELSRKLSVHGLQLVGNVPAMGARPPSVQPI